MKNFVQTKKGVADTNYTREPAKDCIKVGKYEIHYTDGTANAHERNLIQQFCARQTTNKPVSREERNQFGVLTVLAIVLHGKDSFYFAKTDNGTIIVDFNKNDNVWKKSWRLLDKEKICNCLDSVAELLEVYDSSAFMPTTIDLQDQLYLLVKDALDCGIDSVERNTPKGEINFLVVV